MRAIVELLLLLLAVLPPEFAQYRPEKRLNGRAAKPDVHAQPARRYRTVLREAAKEGVNFNGHYRIAWWGCGTNCIEWAVIDLATGKVWMAPEPRTSCWSPEPDDSDTDWMEFYSGSSLLYLHQCEDGGPRTFDTRLVYVWKNGEPRLLRKERLVR